MPIEVEAHEPAAAVRSAGARPQRRAVDPIQAVRTAESRGETLDQLLDRSLAELLQELRVAFTGLQILFAFLPSPSGSNHSTAST